MNESLTTGVLSYIEELSTVIKTASPIIWETLVRQQYVESFSIFAYFVFTVIVFTLGVILYLKRPKWSLNEFDDPVFAIIVSMVSGGCMAIGIFLVFISAIPRIWNPYYYAINDLLNKIP